jgi:hypothetical protein
MLVGLCERLDARQNRRALSHGSDVHFACQPGATLQTETRGKGRYPPACRQQPWLPVDLCIRAQARRQAFPKRFQKCLGRPILGARGRKRQVEYILATADINQVATNEGIAR